MFNDLQEFISQPWPWYIAGPLIGLMVPIMLVVLNKPFGISSSFRHACAMCVPSSVKYFDYNWKAQSWHLMFALGVFIGAGLVYLFFPNPNPVQISEATILKLQSLGIQDHSGLMPKEVFNWDQLSSAGGIIIMIVGGFLVGFGTRYANGCTSGHAIMGLSQLNLGSLFATIGFFSGGLIMSWFVLPLILELI